MILTLDVRVRQYQLIPVDLSLESGYYALPNIN
jgi:hypothetical protein